MIPTFVALSPLLAPAMLAALGPRGPRSARPLVSSFALVACLGLGALWLAGPLLALGLGALGAIVGYVRGQGVDVFGAVVDVVIVCLFASVVLTAVHFVVSRPSLSLTTLGTGAGLVGLFLVRGGYLALSGVGR